MKKVISVLALVLIAAFSILAQSDGRIDNSASGYIFNGVPDGTTNTGDTLIDSIGAAGVDSLWVDLGPCPSNPADSGTFGIVVGGTSGDIACSLFVTLHPSYRQEKPEFMTCISASKTDGSIITDSLTGVSCGLYQIPVMNGKQGYRFVAKVYTFAGGGITALKKIFIAREKE